MNEKLRKQQKNKTADLNVDIAMSTVNVNVKSNTVNWCPNTPIQGT